MLIALLAAAFVGASLGLLGGGGTVLLVPVLTHGLGMPPRAAIASSLIVVAITSLAAAVGHGRAGRVAWRSALLFAPASMVGAALGSHAAGFLAPELLLGLLAGVMLLAAGAMWRARDLRTTPVRPVRLVLAGLATGSLTGLVGAGGGFVVVPALALLGGLEATIAMATSPVILTATALVAFVGHARTVTLDLPLLALIAGTAAASAVISTRFAARIPKARLRQAFALLLVVVGTSELLGLIPGGPRPILAATWPLLVLAAAFVAGLWALRHDSAAPPSDRKAGLA